MKIVTNSTYFLNISQVGYKYNLNSDLINLIYKFLLDMNVNNITEIWYKYIKRVNIVPATYLIELNDLNTIFLYNKTIQVKLNIIINNVNLRLINYHQSKNWWINNLNHLFNGININNYPWMDYYTTEEWTIYFYYQNKILNLINKLNMLI